MKILGIDPGIGRCGWGVIKKEKSKVVALDFGCIETKPNADPGKRLLVLSKELSALITKYKPEAMAVEQLFFNTNAKSAFVVGEARGVVLLAASKNSVPTFTYTPLQIKVALTGYGRAEKTQMGKMVKTLLGLSQVPKLDDTADALAVAITHAFSYNNRGYDRIASGNNRASR